jgi:hypothetical protein
MIEWIGYNPFLGKCVRVKENMEKRKILVGRGGNVLEANFGHQEVGYKYLALG